MKTNLTPQELLSVKKQLPPRLLQFTEIIKKRLRFDWDIVIALTGEEGVGKSSLAIWLGFLIDRNFDLEKNIAYLPSEKDIKTKFNKLKRYSVFDVDEAVKALHKYKWFDELQQMIIEMYATERFQNKCSFVLMPRFRDFTENFRNHRIKIWIHVLHRDKIKGEAVAAAYIRDDDKDIQDPWHCNENIKLKKLKFKGLRVMDRTLSGTLIFERKTPNYMFDFTFPILPKVIEDSYKALKSESRKHLKEIDIQKKKRELIRKYKNSTMKLLKVYKINNPKDTQQDIAALCGLSQRTISRLLNWGKEE